MQYLLPFQRIPWKYLKLGPFILGDVMDKAETLDMPEKETLPVYVNNIHAVMEIGSYCQDVRLENNTKGKKYFLCNPSPASNESEPVLLWLSGAELQKLGGAERSKNYKKSLRVAHDGPLETLFPYATLLPKVQGQEPPEGQQMGQPPPIADGAVRAEPAPSEAIGMKIEAYKA